MNSNRELPPIHPIQSFLISDAHISLLLRYFWHCMYGNFAVRLKVLKGRSAFHDRDPRSPVSLHIGFQLTLWAEPQGPTYFEPHGCRNGWCFADLLKYVTVCQHVFWSIAANWHEGWSGELRYLKWICRSFPFLCHFMSCFRHLTFLFRPHHPTISGCVLARLQCLLQKPWQPREHRQKWRESHGTVGVRPPAPFGLACLIMQAQTGQKRWSLL